MERLIKIPDRLVFLDVETTGLNWRQERIIEVFLLALDKEGQVSELGTLINPGRAIPAQITALTGLTDQDLAHAPREAEISPQIREFIGLSLPVAHNLPFDRNFLNAMFRRTGQLEIGEAGLDTLALSRELFPKLCVYPEGGGSHRLKNLMYHFGLDRLYSNSHRSRDDVLLLVEVFRHLQEYAAGRGGIIYSREVTHGCPNCGSPLCLEWEGGRRVLRCKAPSKCGFELAVEG